jgi:hypothetical protein
MVALMVLHPLRSFVTGGIYFLHPGGRFLHASFPTLPVCCHHEASDNQDVVITPRLALRVGKMTGNAV